MAGAFRTRASESQPAGDSWLLYHGIKNILRCDEAQVVSGIARYVMSQHRAIGTGAALMKRKRGTWLPSLAAVLGAAVRFLEVRPGRFNQGAVFVARLKNERRTLKRFPSLLPELHWSEITLHRRPQISGLIGLVRMGQIGRLSRIARILHRRHEFFKVLRAVELIAYYARYLSIFRQSQFGLAVMSSHSNPHGIAFNLAARRCHVPVVLITHGMPVRPVARLTYDLAIVHCESARQTYLEERCRMDRVLVHGRRGHYVKMIDSLPERLVVGIFLCKDVNEQRFRFLVEALLDHSRVETVLIRPHPKNLWRGLESWIQSQDQNRVIRSRSDDVAGDLARAHVVLAGNSSVLIDSLVAGKHAAYVPDLDYGAPDMHQFVRCGLVYSLGEAESDDVESRRVSINFEDIIRFYQRPEWQGVLRLFANIEEDRESVLTAAASIMRQLANGNVEEDV